MATSSTEGILKLCSWRTFYFFLILSIIVVMVPSLLINFWINDVNDEIQRQVSGDFHRELVLGVQKTATSLLPFNQSVINLSRVLSSLLGRNQLHFSTLETKVAPVLFQALSTIPHLSQVSFIALDGLFFSYYTQGNQLFAIYSNTSILNLSTLPRNYTWYIRPAKFDKLGKLYGEAIQTTPRRILDADWFQKAMKSQNGYASPGTGWKNDQDDPLILNTASVGTKRALSLGYPGKSLVKDFFSTTLAVNGGGLYVLSNDGTEIFTQGITNTRMILQDGNSVSIQLLNQNGNQIKTLANLTCTNGGQSRPASVLNIGEKQYFFQCSLFEILGMPSVYVLALPSGMGKPENFLHYRMKLALFLQILTVGVIAVLGSTFLMYRSGRKEMGLRAQLMRVKEDIQHAERKRMNTIIAYASASHDVRACLAGITGLIQLCLEDQVPPESNLEINLKQAEGCTRDLLGILNMVLDSSKIEAGKIQLEEEEFNIEQVIEETVDLYYPVGMQKGVDVVLDTCDGSLRKYSRATGDRGRLKQILANLLNNAIKFTSQGHVSLRVWAKKPPSAPPPIDQPSFSSPKYTLRRCTPACLRRRRTVFDRNDKTQQDLEKAMDDGDKSRVEYIFEVNDTGKGIPKEMHNVIFENYVQVGKEKKTSSPSSSEHESAGTGLGLGIVQSLVRLMGGEIAIVDKGVGEKGTCFRFNVFLGQSGTSTRVSSKSTPTGDDVDFDEYCYSSGDSYHQQISSEQIIRTIRSPKPERSQVVLLISGEERSNVLKKFMRRRGIQVSVVRDYQQLLLTLDMIKERIHLTRLITSNSMRGKEEEEEVQVHEDDIVVPISEMKSEIITKTPNSVLMVIDTSAGAFEEVSRVTDEFRKEISDIFTRVVWVDIQGTVIGNNRSTNNNIVQQRLYREDIIISRPLHGSRAYQLLSLIRPEFGGKQIEPISRNINVPLDYSSSYRTGEQEIQEVDGRPFLGKKVLVVEDNPVLRRIALAILSRLGAETSDCKNGEEALQLVVHDLNDQRKHRAHFSPPFDCILMDCEMPVMDGYDTTRRIREAEKEIGLHILIFALTAHTGEEEKQKITQAGMDYCLFKPLTEDRLLEAMLYMQVM